MEGAVGLGQFWKAGFGWWWNIVLGLGDRLVWVALPATLLQHHYLIRTKALTVFLPSPYMPYNSCNLFAGMTILFAVSPYVCHEHAYKHEITCNRAVDGGGGGSLPAYKTFVRMSCCARAFVFKTCIMHA